MDQFTLLPWPLIPTLFALALLSLKTLSHIVPKSYQIFGESFNATLLNMQSSGHGLLYFPLLLVCFLCIFISNYLGLIPYSITASTEFVLTLSGSSILLGGILIQSFHIHGFAKTFGLFLPAGTPLALLPLMIPLELLAYLTRTLSLGLRLAVNLITGHILVKVLLSFIPSISSFFGLSCLALGCILFLALEILISYLQAYIFIFITIITMKDMIV
jgi:F-type H+-transporting ATPase subunit a